MYTQRKCSASERCAHCVSISVSWKPTDVTVEANVHHQMNADADGPWVFCHTAASKATTRGCVGHRLAMVRARLKSLTNMHGVRNRRQERWWRLVKPKLNSKPCNAGRNAHTNQQESRVSHVAATNLLRSHKSSRLAVPPRLHSVWCFLLRHVTQTTHIGSERADSSDRQIQGT